MSSFLDKAGLTYFWSKLKAKFSSLEQKDTWLQEYIEELEQFSIENYKGLKSVINNSPKNLCKLGFTHIAASSSNPSVMNNIDSITINGSRTASSATIRVYDLVDGKSLSQDTRYTIPAGKYVCKGTGTSYARIQVYAHNGTAESLQKLSDVKDDYEFEYSAAMKQTYPYICFRLWISGSSTFNNLTIYPMICTKAVWEVSSDYVPYIMPLKRQSELLSALAPVIDAGPKNRLTFSDLAEIKIQNGYGTWNGNVYEFRGVTYTLNSDFSITANGTATGGNANFVLSPRGGFSIETGNWVLSGCPAGGSTSTYNISIASTASDTGDTAEFTSCSSVLTRIYVIDGTTINNLTFKPMVCSKAEWLASQAYVPYRPSYQELYERVKALENA